MYFQSRLRAYNTNVLVVGLTSSSNHCSSIPVFFSLITEEEGEPWDEDAPQKCQKWVKSHQAITGRTNESQITTHAISHGHVKGNYVGTFHQFYVRTENVGWAQYEG